MFALAFLFTFSAFAQLQGLRQFQVEKADFSPQQVQSPLSAQMNVDYSASQVTLQIQRAMPPCLKNQVCVQMMPEPMIVQLPITKIEKQNCGIFHLIAEQDLRPNDGAVSRIELEDTSSITCHTLLPTTGNASYTTSYLDHQTGQERTAVSTMTISPVAQNVTNSEALNFVKGAFLKGFPSYFVPANGSLKIADDKIEMTIEVVMNCQNRICPHIIPQPIHVELPVVKTEATECGHLITARQDSRMADGSYEEIQITDFQNSTCRFVTKPLIEVHYLASFPNRGPASEHEATFSFDR
jgi:hypothetical protein